MTLECLALCFHVCLKLTFSSPSMSQEVPNIRASRFLSIEEMNKTKNIASFFFSGSSLFQLCLSCLLTSVSPTGKWSARVQSPLDLLISHSTQKRCYYMTSSVQIMEWNSVFLMFLQLFTIFQLAGNFCNKAFKLRIEHEKGKMTLLSAKYDVVLNRLQNSKGGERSSLGRKKERGPDWKTRDLSTALALSASWSPLGHLN